MYFIMQTVDNSNYLMDEVFWDIKKAVEKCKRLNKVNAGKYRVIFIASVS